MATKIDSPSIEPSSTQSTVAASNPKVSKFGAKSGFVIPKNKLSGSLVPIYRGTAKAGSGNTVKEESTPQVQRKTKWGPDPTQDAAVRKGRALAYQTRVDQISQQLKSGALEIGVDQGSHFSEDDSKIPVTAEHVNQEAEKFELLKLERREIIGEILRLNPSYKAPPDYKPILKEGKVPIPVKEYPGYNFIGLLLGPESNTQKRLEEETGAKIQVYGIKTNAKEKREITQSDVADTQYVYEELFVNVTADTYDKVDAAVALIELLVTPVSGNAAVAPKTSTSAADYTMMPVINVNQGTSQPMIVATQSGAPHYQQPHPSSWIPGPQNVPSRPPGGFMAMQNNSIRFPQAPTNLPNMQPYFGRPPPFGLAQPQLNQPFSHPNNTMPTQRPPSVYPAPISSPALAPNSRPSFTMPMMSSRPPVPTGWTPGPANVPLRPPQTGPMPNTAPRAPPPNFQPPFPSQSSPTVPQQRPYPVVSVPRPIQPSVQPPSFTPINPPVSTQLPLRPSLSDFTFQPQRQQFPPSPAAPQAPSFRPALQSPQGRGPAPPLPSPGGSFHANRLPPSFPFPQVGHANFAPAPSMSRLPPPNRPGGLMMPNHPLGFTGGRVPLGPRGNQTYDPFSPTSVRPGPPPQAASAKSRNGDTDPEYEDLMASVGVK